MSATDRHQQAPTPVRLPDDLKAALKSNATANDRSLNGEVIARLRDSFEPDGMTLRDHFAGQELSKVDGAAICDIPSAYARVADHCYRMADAMLKAREA